MSSDRTTLNICTYNTRTINDLNEYALHVMLEELKDVHWDIVGLSETKVKGTDIQILEESGHHLFFSGNETSRSNGVGFLVKKSIEPFVDDFNPISDRLAVLTVKGKFSRFIIIQCYFPTSEHPDEEVDTLYDQIQEIINTVPKRDHLIVMGDFNSKVGGLHTSYGSAIGKHTTGTHNARGLRLAKFCVQNNLAATNTMFKKRLHYTWTSPNGKTKNQIDFVLVRNSFRHHVTNSSALNKPDISDHRLVRTTLKLKFIWPKRNTFSKKYDLQQLGDPQIRDKFEIELSNHFSALSLEESPDVETTSESITSAIINSVENVLSLKDTKVPEWMTTNTKTAINEKHKVRQQFGPKSNQYKIAKAETKKLVKKDKIQHIENEHETLSSLPPHKQFHAAIKKLKAKKRSISWGIQNKDGRVLTSRSEILEQWATFYEELYNDDYTPIPVDDSCDPNIPEITNSEIEHHIKLLKNGKSAGLDNIYSEYLKAGGEHIISALHILFNIIIKTNTVPSSFKKALIVVIFKKGMRTECKNYRPISLLSHIYKLFTSIISTRVKNDLYSSLPHSQAAYQPNRGTTEQIFALEQIIEKSIEFNNPVHILFIDFTKAFDSITLSSLWALLEKTSINKRYINLLQSTYNGSESAIKTDIGVSRFVKILKGVKQGDILAAILFCIIVASIILLSEEECDTGFSIGGQILSNLSYADDIAAMSHNRVMLQKFIDALSKHAKNVGLSINISKTKCMTTDKIDKKLSLTIYDQPIDQVTQFVYLGHKLSSINDNSIAVEHRLALGWSAFSKHKDLLTSSRIPYHIKAKIYNTYILPVVLYGLDCVVWNQTLLNKIEVFQNHIMRFITNHRLRDRIRITHLRDLTKLPPLASVIKSRCLKLYGHTKRSNAGLAKLCLEGMIPGVRSRGRPRRRWRDNIYEWTGMDLPTLNQASKNRVTWKAISHVSAHSAAGGDSVT